MTTLRSEIHIADLIRAIQILEPDEEAMKHIASTLGFRFVAETPVPPTKPIGQPPKTSRYPTQWKPKSRRPKLTGEVMISLSVEVIDEGRPVKLPMPDMPAPLEVRDEESEPLPKYLPLLTSIWTRAILSKMLSVNTEDDVPDVPKLIEILSKNLPLEQIPHQMSPTLRRGVQVLVDSGPGLAPYTRDQMLLLEQIRQIVSNDRVDAWGFIGTPLQYTVPYNRPDHPGYELPTSGTPILMLTDLGIAAPPFATEIATPDEWDTFIQQVRRAGCPLLALVPYRRSRWPDAFACQIKVIEWDHTTSVLTISRSVS